MPWLGIAALGFIGWYIFIRHNEGRWVRTDTAGITPVDKPTGDWISATYQAGNSQLWYVTKGLDGMLFAARPGTGGSVSANTLDELAIKMDNW